MILAAQTCPLFPSWTTGIWISLFFIGGLVTDQAKKLKAAEDEIVHYRIELDRAHRLMNVLKARKDR